MDSRPEFIYRSAILLMTEKAFSNRATDMNNIVHKARPEVMYLL